MLHTEINVSVQREQQIHNMLVHSGALAIKCDLPQHVDVSHFVGLDAHEQLDLGHGGGRTCLGPRRRQGLLGSGRELGNCGSAGASRGTRRISVVFVPTVLVIAFGSVAADRSDI